MVKRRETENERKGETRRKGEYWEQVVKGSVEMMEENFLILNGGERKGGK